MARIRPVFEALRDDCPKAIWSQGISLSRSATVQKQSDDGDEIVLLVTSPIALMARTVRVFIDDEDWMCDCKASDDACDHAVVGLLALQRAEDEGEELPDPGQGGSQAVAMVQYRFSRSKGGLRLSRMLVAGDYEEPLTGTVTGAAIRGGDGPKVVANPIDLKIESQLSYRFPEWLPAPHAKKLLRTLSVKDDLTLDGAPVSTSPRAVGLLARVTDGDYGGFMVQLIQDPSISEVFNCEVALCGGVLRPIDRDTGLSAREMGELRGGRIYRADEVSVLVGEVLPSLKKRLPLQVQTSKLPETTKDAPPRLLMEAIKEGHELVVMPTIVYGDPAIARLSGDKLIPLGGKQVPIRQPDEEARLKRRANGTMGLLVGHRARLVGEDAVAFAQKIGRWPGTVTGDGLKGFHLAPPLEPQVGFLDHDLDGERYEDELGGEGDWGIAFSSPGKGKARTGDVLRAWRAGASLVPLDDGGWAPLPIGWLERFGSVVSDIVAAKQAAGELPPSAFADVTALCRDLDVPPPRKLGHLRDQFSAGIQPATLPSDLRAELRDYQRAGVDWLSFLRDGELGGMLADDMGLGKTLQALCAIRGRTLVVAPTSVLYNWAREIEKFRPELTVNVFHGPKRKDDPDADVTLTSYAIMRIEIERLTQEMWDSVVLDEAQYIKNPDSKVARAAYRLRGRFKLTLTGTPVENRLDELWSQVHFANPGLLGDRKDFQERYAKPIAEGTPGVAKHLRERLRPFLLRRLKRDVAPELPARTDLVLRCELTEAERTVYEGIRLATREEVVSRLRQGGGVLQALEALLRLRQAACHSGLIPGLEAETSSKVDTLLDTLDTACAEGHKALVFSQWTSLLDRIEPRLEGAGLKYVRLDGSTRDRQAVVDAFQDPDGPPVMLLSLKAGGTGLNLTAADHVFMMDPWWNPAVEDQAADRAHRIGQERPVFVHRLVAADTVEEGILALQERKRALADAALAGADRAASLTRDDLLALLN